MNIGIQAGEERRIQKGFGRGFRFGFRLVEYGGQLFDIENIEIKIGGDLKRINGRVDGDRTGEIALPQAAFSNRRFSSSTRVVHPSYFFLFLI